MVYQALYRRWRPKTFSAVVGQEAITETLKNAIKRQQISHAFLFAGPRGTGKTSCAKIFAKALNCTNLQDGEPCNQCPNCLAADHGAMNDLLEIDAASNNGVDEIRNIRDKVKYAPTQGKYKIYIIDEVHMLSIGAFNALLKTLEEPPQNVVFILATTELQKVPATIISRTQRFQFKRISDETLITRMKFILDQEKITYDPKALSVVAQVADGGMRDALSILDQLLSYDGTNVKYEDALQLTGFAAQEQIEALLLILLKHDPAAALQKVQQLLKDGAMPKNILDELIDLSARALLALQADIQTQFLTSDFIQKLKPYPQSAFSNLIELANTALTDLRYTNQQRVPLDVFLVKACQEDVPEKAALKSGVSRSDFDALNQKVIALTQKFQERRADQSVSVSVQNTAKTPEPSKSENRQAVYQVLEHATRQDLNAVKDIWPDLLSTLGVSQRALLDVLEPVAASPTKIVLKCQYELWFERANKDNALLEHVTQEIAKLTKHDYHLVLIADSAWLKVRQAFVESHKKELLAQKHPTAVQPETSKADDEKKEEIVTKAKALFGDAAHIHD